MNAFHYYYFLFLFFTFSIDVNNRKMITYVCNQYTLNTICQTIQIIAKNIIYQSSWWFSNSSWPIDQGNKGICIHHICKFSCCSMHIKENIKAPRHWPLCGEFTGPVNSPHKGPVTRKMFPFDDVIMKLSVCHSLPKSLIFYSDLCKHYLKCLICT